MTTFLSDLHALHLHHVTRSWLQCLPLLLLISPTKWKCRMVLLHSVKRLLSLLLPPAISSTAFWLHLQVRAVDSMFSPLHSFYPSTRPNRENLVYQQSLVKLDNTRSKLSVPALLQFYGNTGKTYPCLFIVQTQWSCSIPCFYCLKSTVNPDMLSFHV
jgi:hypothetical protein